MTLTVAEAELLAFIEEEQAILRDGVRECVEKADALTLAPITESWEKIEKAARRRVEKSREGLTQEQAVDRVLRERPQLYEDYLAATERVRQTIAKADEAAAKRAHDEWVAERFLDRVQKSADLFEDESEAASRLLDAETAEALGLEFVEKAADDDAYSPIAAAGRRLMEADPSLSMAQACALAVEQNPQLYSTYIEKMGRLQYEATNPPLNSDGVASPSGLFGAADGEPRRADVAKAADEVWDTIVRKSGADPSSPGFSKAIDRYLSTAEGEQLYAAYERAYEAAA